MGCQDLLDDVPGRSKKDSGVFASPSDQQKSWYKLKPSSSKTYNIKDETSSKCLCPKCSISFHSTCSKIISSILSIKYASNFWNVKFYFALNEICVKLKSPKLYSPLKQEKK